MATQNPTMHPRTRIISKYLVAVLLIALLLEAGLLWLFGRIPQAQTFLPLRVVSDPAIYDWSPDEAPNWFHFDDPTVAEVAYFREAVQPPVDASTSTFEQYLAVMDWVRRQAVVADSTQAIPGDPIAVHQAMLAGIPAQCGNFSTLYVAASTSVGLPFIRVWHFSSADDWNHYGHVVNEVWVPELSRWVMLDPMNNAYVLVDGEPGSVTVVREALLTGQRSRLELVVGPNAHTSSDTLLNLYEGTMPVVRMEAAHTPLHDYYYESWTDQLVGALPEIGGLPHLADRAFTLVSGRALHVTLIDDLSGEASHRLPIREAKAVFGGIVGVAVVILLDCMWLTGLGIRRLLLRGVGKRAPHLPANP